MSLPTPVENKVCLSESGFRGQGRPATTTTTTAAAAGTGTRKATGGGGGGGGRRKALNPGRIRASRSTSTVGSATDHIEDCRRQEPPGRPGPR